MDVRPARPTDAPLALALSLDDTAHLVKGKHWPVRTRPLQTVARAGVPLCSRGRLWVARDEMSVALLEAVPRRYVIGWDITRLSVRGDIDRVVPALLAGATDFLQRRGVPRLFARCSPDAAESLGRAGFSPLAREYVLVGPEARHGDVETELPDDSRYRMPQDAWPLHQLESDTTPALVRQVEGLTSTDWSHRVRHITEIVVERDGKVAGWIGWGARVGHHRQQVGMLVRREYSAVGPELLRHVLAQVRDARLVTRVRDYQQDVWQAFLDAGFTITAEEILMVRHARMLAVPAKRRMMVVPMPTARIVRHGCAQQVQAEHSPARAILQRITSA